MQSNNLPSQHIWWCQVPKLWRCHLVPKFVGILLRNCHYILHLDKARPYNQCNIVSWSTAHISFRISLSKPHLHRVYKYVETCLRIRSWKMICQWNMTSFWGKMKAQDLLVFFCTFLVKVFNLFNVVDVSVVNSATRGYFWAWYPLITWISLAASSVCGSIPLR